MTEDQQPLDKLQVMLLRIEGAITAMESLLGEAAQSTGGSHVPGD